jgi:hypothetical protein
VSHHKQLNLLFEGVSSSDGSKIRNLDDTPIFLLIYLKGLKTRPQKKNVQGCFWQLSVNLLLFNEFCLKGFFALFYGGTGI